MNPKEYIQIPRKINKIKNRSREGERERKFREKIVLLSANRIIQSKAHKSVIKPLPKVY